MITNNLLEVVAVIWLWVEIGQFIKEHVGWGKHKWYWLVWIFLVVAIISLTMLLDAHV